MKRILATVLITIGHAVITWALFLRSFTLGMSRFDTGGPMTAGDRVLNTVVEILMWPFFVPLTRWGGRWVHSFFPGLLGYIPLLLNSLIWALVITWLWQTIQRKKKASNHALHTDALRSASRAGDR